MLSFIRVELTRTFLEIVRYPANMISYFGIHTMMFYGLFLGAQYMSGKNSFGDTLDTMVVGYAAWVLVTRAFHSLPFQIQYEASSGVLTSIFLSSYNKGLIYLMRGFSAAIISIIMVLIMLIVIVFMTGSSIAFPIAAALPVLTILCSAIGVSLFAGSLALHFKRVGSILPTIQFVLMFLMFAPFEEWTTGLEAGLASIAQWLPMVPSVILLRDLMVHENPLNLVLLMKAVGNGAVYVLLGVLVFNRMVESARNKGLVGGY